ncbi:MAG TPA: hypothetical protein VNF73_12520 [Candidatus Saccharimonadales bacterium]|nr:hypothetical protein [Candidatus Saccharimonadales bacterium]
MAVVERLGRRRPWQSAYGFGSVFAKGLRDSRRAVLAAGFGLGLIIVVTAYTVATQFGTVAQRADLTAISTDLPAALGALLGQPLNVDRLGGFISWRTLSFAPVVFGLWSVLALSGTLGSEASRGSLDLLATTGISRTRLAIEKAFGHVAGLAVASVIVALLTWFSGLAFARLPGDEIALTDALSQLVGVALVGLVAGAVAFALAPVFGRSIAAGVGAIALFGAYIVNSYATLVPVLGAVRGLSWFAWTEGHRPMAGVSDPGSVVAVGALSAVFLALGVVVFARRDIGITVSLPSAHLPGRWLGLGGPIGRSFADRLPAATVWGLGIGLYGLVFGASASQFARAFDQIPGLDHYVGQFFPNVNFHTASGVLQFVFFSLGLFVAGLAAAALVSGWSSDEREKRLDVVLAAPLSRIRWMLSGAGGLLGAVAVMTIVMGVLVAIGAAIDGDAMGTPFSGAMVIGLYAAALTGIGLAVGGVLGPGLAATVTAGLALVFFLVEYLGQGLNLPDIVLQLSLMHHLGQPMVGTYDWPGMALLVVLAIGGAVVGAIGLRRRDLST